MITLETLDADSITQLKQNLSKAFFHQDLQSASLESVAQGMMSYLV